MSKAKQKTPATATPPDTRGCCGCYYWDKAMQGCIYILIEGHRRPCPGGRACTVRKAIPRKRRSNT